MSRELDKKEIKILMDRWLAGDKTLAINERVFILEKMVRKLIKADNANSHRMRLGFRQ